MREVCFLLKDDQILRAYFGTATRIPDSHDRWEAIWTHRDQLTEIVHTHPGGSLGFSGIDVTTIQAVEAGIARSITWSIVTQEAMVSRRGPYTHRRVDAPWWLAFLRELSFEGHKSKTKRKERHEISSY